MDAGLLAAVGMGNSLMMPQISPLYVMATTAVRVVPPLFEPGFAVTVMWALWFPNA